METLVVITYLPSAAQGRELEYAIAGWRMHFKEPSFRIVVVGEHLSPLPGDDLTFIESPRVPASEGNYRAHCDYVSCLRKVRQAFPEQEGFILVADDCYAMNDFTLEDVKVRKILETDLTTFKKDSSNAWRRDKARTRELLLEIQPEGPIANYTSHLPIWYEWSKVEALWDMWHMEEKSYVIEDLYHNLLFDPKDAYILTHDNPYKLGVYYIPIAMETLRKAEKERIWITNSPDGWCQELINLCEDHYKKFI